MEGRKVLDDQQCEMWHTPPPAPFAIHLFFFPYLCRLAAVNFYWLVIILTTHSLWGFKGKRTKISATTAMESQRGAKFYIHVVCKSLSDPSAIIHRQTI